MQIEVINIKKIEPLLDELKEIDDVLYQELKEVNDFEAELFYLEYELGEEERIIAKLHNSCQITVSVIRHLHSLFRQMDKKPDDSAIPIFKDMIQKQLDELHKDLSEITSQLDRISEDEKAGQKIVRYCRRVENIVRKKLVILQEKFNAIPDK